MPAMLRRKVDRLLPYAAETLFGIAADVERYPEFLPWWTDARIRRREADTYYTDQTLRLGPLHVRFDSRAILERPQRIDVTVSRFPFRELKLTWTFAPVSDGGCRVELVAELDFVSVLFQKIAEQAIRSAMDEVIAAFEARARELTRR